MVWTNPGLIVEPNPDIWWMSHYAGRSFVEVSDGDTLRIFFTSRDGNNVFRIGITEVSRENPVSV